MIGKRSSLVLLVASLSAGCYGYHSISPGEAIRGTTVRVALLDDGSVALRPLLGPSAARLEGLVQQADDSSITLSVTELVRRDGVAETWTGESVRIRRSEMDLTEQRSFSRAQTGILVGILAGGAAIAATASRSGGTVAVPQPGPPQPGH